MRMRRTLLVFAAATLALAIGAAPVAAYRELKTTGTVGAHSLTDARPSPGADCIYKFSDRGTKWVLRRINIDPPNVRAVSGQGSQQVGWIFTIERRIRALSDDPWGPWEHRYTSPEMTATTDSTHDAAFSPMGVRVLGASGSTADSEYFYRATVKSIWYRNNGKVMGTATMRVEWFKSFMGTNSDKRRWSCIGHVY